MLGTRNEIRWARIDDTDYSVSSIGQVRNDSTGKLLKPYSSNSHSRAAQYPHVNIRYKDKWRHRSVHRLMASAFFGDSEKCVNHKDGNKLNNTLENLEYVTYSENNLHAYRIGLRSRTCAKLTEAQVKEIKQSNEIGSLLAVKYNISRAQIYSIRNKRAWVSVEAYG